VEAALKDLKKASGRNSFRFLSGVPGYCQGAIEARIRRRGNATGSNRSKIDEEACLQEPSL
jgi:hypothetical protein